MNNINLESDTRIPNSYSSSSLASKKSQIDYKNIRKWSIDNTLEWLASVGYQDCDKYFIEHKINGRALLMLNEEDLKEVIKHNVGQRKNLYHLIKQLQINYNKARSSSSFFESDCSSSSNESEDLDLEEETNLEQKNPTPNLNDLNESHNRSRNKNNLPNLCENCQAYNLETIYTQSPIRCYRGEKRKTFVSVVYLFFTCLWTSFMLTVVHDRVPDMEKYPPLPDIILDNVPLIPWAFFATELIGLALVIIMIILLILHKYRFV